MNQTLTLLSSLWWVLSPLLPISNAARGTIEDLLSIGPSMSSKIRIQKNYVELRQTPFDRVSFQAGLPYQIQTELGAFKTAGKTIAEMLFRPRSSLHRQTLSAIPKKMRARAKPIIPAVFQLCELYQVDPFWALAIIWTESHFKAKALSPVGAQGPMQLMPDTKHYLSALIQKKYPKRNLAAIKHELSSELYSNLELGIFYLKNLRKLFHGNSRLATVSYNMGPGWTLRRVKRGLPAGVRNRYLNKVRIAYDRLTQPFLNGSYAGGTPLASLK